MNKTNKKIVQYLLDKDQRESREYCDERDLWGLKLLVLLDPTAINYGLKADAYAFIGLYNKAIRNYSKASKLDPENVKYIKYRAYNYSEIDRDDLALEDYKKVLLLDPTDEDSLFYSSFIYARMKEYETALVGFNKIIELYPTNIQVNFEKGVILSILGKDDEAIENIKTGIKLNPDLLGLVFQMSLHKTNQQDDNKCIVNFNKVYEEYHPVECDE